MWGCLEECWKGVNIGCGGDGSSYGTETSVEVGSKIPNYIEVDCRSVQEL